VVMPLVESPPGTLGAWFNWEKDPAVYEQARARLAAMIVAAGR